MSLSYLQRPDEFLQQFGLGAQDPLRTLHFVAFHTGLRSSASQNKCIKLNNVLQLNSRDHTKVRLSDVFRVRWTETILMLNPRQAVKEAKVALYLSSQGRGFIPYGYTPYCYLVNKNTISSFRTPSRREIMDLSIIYNFMPNALCTLMLCRILRSSMISSLPPGIA